MHGRKFVLDFDIARGELMRGVLTRVDCRTVNLWTKWLLLVVSSPSTVASVVCV